MISLIYLCLGVVLCNSQAIEFSTFRLRRDVLPTSYSLKIVPAVDGETFEGDVTIYLKILQPIGNVTLNSRNLKIKETTLDQNYGSTKYILDPANEIIYVLYADGQNIDPGEHVLHISYTGTFGNYHGFYKFQSSEYKNQTMLATKFSPNHARSVFPCFDEPYFKSIFDVRLVKPNNSWEIISNMREISKYETEEGLAVDFESTVPMSTYLLAWVYTDYKYDELLHKSNNKTIPLRFYANNNKPLIIHEALKYTERALTFFENYTGIPFPLSKLDSISLPLYASKGMEHYGLIIYLNRAMFDSNPLMSKLLHSLDAVLLICHEVSHMWFGNLVTHAWYNDLWLTEGFARYMQYKAGVALLGEPFVAYMFQESKYLMLSQEKCYGYASETASFPRKITEVKWKYSPNTYDQGAALLLMLEDLIGHEKFREAIKNNLQNHKFSSATTGEFINLMQDTVPTLKIRDVMMTYLFQNKLPLLAVTIEKDFFVLRQTPLCSEGAKSIFGDKWTIPVRYITSSNKTSRIAWFDRDMIHVRIPRTANDKWIQINHMSVGLYRVKYSTELYLAIGNDFETLERVDVGPFIEDAFFLSSLGKIPCDVPLRLIGGLKGLKDMDFFTFTYASRSFSMFSRNFDDTPSVTKILREYFIYLFGHLYSKESWHVEEGETMEKRLLRMQVLESFCRMSVIYPECYKDINSFTADNVTIHGDVSYIYKAVLMNLKRMNSTMMKEVLGNRESNYLPEEGSGLGGCISWIKQNIPKFIHNGSQPSTT